MSRLSQIDTLKEEIRNQEAELKDYQRLLGEYEKLKENYFKVCHALLHYAKPQKESNCDIAWNTLSSLNVI